MPAEVFPSVRILRSSASVDRKSTRLNSSHSQISYAVFCLKKTQKLSDVAVMELNEPFMHKYLACPRDPGIADAAFAPAHVDVAENFVLHVPETVTTDVPAR